MTDSAPSTLENGEVYLIPSHYGGSASDATGEYMPALHYTDLKSEDGLQLFVEPCVYYIGLPKWHMVSREEVRAMGATFDNSVGTPLSRAEWAQQSEELMRLMDHIMVAAVASHDRTCTAKKRRRVRKRT